MKNLIQLLKETQNSLIKKYEITAGAVLIKGSKEGLKPLLTAHLDTINTHRYKSALNSTDLDIIGNTITLNKKSKASCLGGDDRCGVWIVESLLKNSINDYDILLTTDEEIGGIGVGTWCNTLYKDENWSCIISLDRRSPNGVNEFATYGFDAQDLNNIFLDLGFQEGMGSYTDGVTVAEHTKVAMINLSVGYDNEHTKNEIIYYDKMVETLKLLQNQEFIRQVSKKQFEVEELPYYDDFFIENTPIVCEVCGEHTKLYDANGYFVCADCLNFIQ